MFRLILGAWLLTTAAFAQNPAPSKSKAAKSTSGAQPVQLGRTSTASGKDVSGSGNDRKQIPDKPIPKPSASSKAQSGNALNPNYQKEDAKGRGIESRYSTPDKVTAPKKKDNQ